MLLLIEKLLNVVGAELGSISLLLACVAASLAILDLRLATFSAWRGERYRAFGGGQLLVEIGLLVIDCELLAIDDRLLTIGDALI